MQLETRGTTAWITWERPGSLNAWDRSAVTTLGQLLADAAQGPARAIVCHGLGGNFSAGDDLRDSAQLTAEEWHALNAGWARLTREALAAPKPVIAAIEGACIGGALEFAYACDITLAAGDARLGCPEVAVGLAVYGGFSYLAPRLARALILTGEMLDAVEALRLGLIDRVVDDPIAEDTRLADLIATRAPLSVAATKRLFAFIDRQPAEDALTRETRESDALYMSADAQEGIAAFLQKRQPRFTGD